LGEGAGEAFGKLSEAADAVQRLADFLERNPNALLTGKKAPR
jgi:paraquat-inducible protein B